MIGLGLRTQIAIVLETSIVPGLLSELQSRATYFENANSTTEILTDFENCG